MHVTAKDNAEGVQLLDYDLKTGVDAEGLQK